MLGAVVAMMLTQGHDLARAGVQAKLGTNVNYERGREFVSTRIEEDGFYFNTSLTVSGSKGRPMDITIFSANGLFLGHTQVVPPYESTSWDKLHIFVPYSRITRLSYNYDFVVYAISPKSSNAYVDKVDYSNSSAHDPEVTWDWRGFDNDVVLPGSGEMGFVGRLTLNIRGYKDTPIRVVGLVRNQRDGEFSDEPIRIDGGALQPQFESSVYKTLELTVPYSKLTQLAPAEIVTLTPAIEVNGVLTTGNVHFRFLAGGSFDRVERLTNQAIESNTKGIESLRRQMEILRQGVKP